MSEKTEKPTPYKLQKAKEKGQVSKSTEINSCVLLLVIIGLIAALWSQQLEQMKNLSKQLLVQAAILHFNLDTVNHLMQLIWQQLLNFWAPFLIAALVAVILTNLAQTGFVWALASLTPDLKRLHPKQGLKKIFSLKIFFESAKSLAKLAIALLFISFTFKNNLPNLLILNLAQPHQAITLMMHYILKTLFQLLLLLAAIAVIDKLYSTWSFTKSQRMSKQDLKEEYKQKEGDPKVKSKIKQLQQQLRQKTASLKQIKTADIIITNPTHLAIALKYDKHTMPAPKVICKAQDELVKEVKKLAHKYAIPIVENKAFARLLYQSTGLNQYIQTELYPMAAPIFKALYQRRVNHGN